MVIYCYFICCWCENGYLILRSFFVLYVLLALVGIFSGLLGSMGMGGGTLLIPLLTIFFNFNQKIAQGINLVSFSVMALVIIFIHIKNKLIDIKVAIRFGLIALVFSCLGAFVANIISSSWLKVLFGVLLIGVAIFEVVCEIKKIANNNEKK